jgi:hypothetical protein
MLRVMVTIMVRSRVMVMVRFMFKVRNRVSVLLVLSRVLSLG